MHRIFALAAFASLLATPAIGTSATVTLCGGRVELLSVSPQWYEDTPGQRSLGLHVVAANRSGEAILLQPLLTTGGRPQHGNPLMLVRHGQRSFALRLPPEQVMAPEALMQALGASCRLS